MKLTCEGWSKDGIINILIQSNGKNTRYKYIVDTTFIPNWLKRMSHTPGKILNEIKTNAINTIRLN